MLILGLFGSKLINQSLCFTDEVFNSDEHLLILCFCSLKFLFEAVIVLMVQLVEYFHLEGSQSLPPDSEFFLNVTLELFFFLAVLVGELPVVFGLR